MVPQAVGWSTHPIFRTDHITDSKAKRWAAESTFCLIISFEPGGTNTMSSLPQFISPSIFQSEVTISKPRIDLERAAQLIQNDATKTFGWPKDLPVETITQNLRCVYLAQWIATGQGSGQ